MDKNRPTGRRKNIGQGSADVHKRGDGMGEGGGPVGNAGGYSGRESSPSASQSRGTGRGADLGGLLSGVGSLLLGKGKSGGLSKKWIIILLVIGLAIYAYYQFKSNNAENTQDATAATATIQAAATHAAAGTVQPNASVSNAARAKRTILKGGGRDTATVMVYMCASDLESRGGMATADIQEMMYATLSDKVNVILQTGGTTKWRNKTISSKTNQRYRVTEQGLELLEGDLGRDSMADPDTLSDFIRYSKQQYPADRYILVLWDHGGGSLGGYARDEYDPINTMTLDEIAKALQDGGCSFDLIGFDACLMGAFETAIVLEPHADYMIASEEVEPGSGWDYTGWFSALSSNTSMPTVDLGRVLVDDYIQATKEEAPQAQATLSLIDLAELKGTVPSAFSSFASSTASLIDNEKYNVVSNARANTREFAQQYGINQIDLIHFADNLGTPESKAFASVLRNCVKYNRTSGNITHSNGLSIFFPYGDLSTLTPMLETYNAIGIDSKYSDCIKGFASVAAGGQVVSGGSGNLLQTLLGTLVGNTQAPSSGTDIVGDLLSQFLGGGDFSGITGVSGDAVDWLDAGRMRSSLGFYRANRFDATALKITKKDGKRVLTLSEEQWNLVQNLEQNVFVDDGEGFIDLGLDNVFEFNSDGDLLMDFDGTWLALNGHVVSYYMLTDDRDGDRYTINGRIPALLNGQPVDIIVSFSDENPDGMVLGARVRYDKKQNTETVARGLLKIVKGDKIDYLCDYYTYDGKYNDTYYLGDPYTATGKWKVENLSIGDSKYQMTYRITDIYNNRYWTPSVKD